MVFGKLDVNSTYKIIDITNHFHVYVNLKLEKSLKPI